MPLRLAFDARLATWSGVGTYTRGLLGALAEQADEQDIRLLVLRNPDDEFLHRLAPAPDVEWALVAGDPWLPIGALEAGRAARGRADVYHAPHVTIPLGFDGPLVTTIHDLIPLLHPETMPNPLRRAAFRATVHAAVRRSAVILCDTRFAAQTLHDLGFRPRSLAIVRPGIGSEFRPQTPDRVAEVTRKYGLEPEYLLWVGAFRPHKDVITLIRAYAGLPLEMRATHDLALAGDPETPYGDTVRRLAAELLGDEARRIRFVGFVEQTDLPALYTGASLFVFPSLIEGFGLPPLEAAACRCPVVAADAPPMPEVLGDASVYFKAQDYDSLARAIGRLLESTELIDCMSRQAFRRARKTTWEAAAMETTHKYRRPYENR